MFWPLATTSCGNLWLQIAFFDLKMLWPLVLVSCDCQLRPQRSPAAAIVTLKNVQSRSLKAAAAAAVAVAADDDDDDDDDADDAC